jgi:hypothetical protein
MKNYAIKKPRMQKVARQFAEQLIMLGRLDTYGTEWTVKDSKGEVYPQEVIEQLAKTIPPSEIRNNT